MTDKTELELGIHQTHDEHLRLHQLLDACRRALDFQGTPQPALLAKLQATLTELHDHLAGHFTQEENGGWLEEAVTRLPRLAKQLNVLEKQHAALLGRLALLIELMQTTPADKDTVKKAVAQFDAFAKQLLAHEACEERSRQRDSDRG